MLEDEVRTRTYREALFATCKGKVVLDIGCGSGILSIFAAQGGAIRVVAVEGSPRTAALAREAVERNSLSDIISVVCGRVEDEAVGAEVDAQLRRDLDPAAAAGDEVPKVDLLVSEWMGYMLVHEDMFPSVAYARDRWLRIGGLIVPAACSVWAAPFSGEDFVEELTSYWNSFPYGLDMSHLAKPEMQELFCKPVIDDLNNKRMLGRPTRLWRLSCASAKANDPSTQRVPFEFEVGRAGPLHGVAVWFKCALTPAIAFTTGPSATPTHWAQTLLFAGERGEPGAGGAAVEPGGMPVEKNDRVKGELFWNCVGRTMEVELQGTIESESAESRQFNASYHWSLRLE